MCFLVINYLVFSNFFGSLADDGVFFFVNIQFWFQSWLL